MADALTVTAPADFHVHLRQGTFAELVTKHVRVGGFGLAYVMVRVVSPYVSHASLTEYGSARMWRMLASVAQLGPTNQDDGRSATL
jgi:dihydroorotase